MNELVVYIKAFGLAVDEFGNKDYGGMRLGFGVEMPNDKTYENIIKNTTPEAVLAAVGIPMQPFEDMDMEFITREEYERDYGNDAEDDI